MVANTLMFTSCCGLCLRSADFHLRQIRRTFGRTYLFLKVLSRALVIKCQRSIHGNKNTVIVNEYECLVDVFCHVHDFKLKIRAIKVTHFYFE